MAQYVQNVISSRNFETLNITVQKSSRENRIWQNYFALSQIRMVRPAAVLEIVDTSATKAATIQPMLSSDSTKYSGVCAGGGDLKNFFLLCKDCHTEIDRTQNIWHELFAKKSGLNVGFRNISKCLPLQLLATCKHYVLQVHPRL